MRKKIKGYNSNILPSDAWNYDTTIDPNHVMLDINDRNNDGYSLIGKRWVPYVVKRVSHDLNQYVRLYRNGYYGDENGVIKGRWKPEYKIEERHTPGKTTNVYDFNLYSFGNQIREFIRRYNNKEDLRKNLIYYK